MTTYTKAIELEKKLKEMKAAKDKIEKIYSYMIAKRHELLFDNDEFNNSLNDAESMLCQMNIDCNTVISKFAKLIDKAWSDFYAQEYEGEGEEK